MTESEQNEAMRRRQKELRQACDIIDPRTPRVISVDEAKARQRALKTKRQAGTIEPSQNVMIEGAPETRSVIRDTPEPAQISAGSRQMTINNYFTAATTANVNAHT